MKTCATCRYWEEPETQEGVEELGRCSFTPQLWDVTHWNDDGVLTMRPEYADRLAFVSDGSDYHARLLALATFGCVQHKG